MKFRVNPKNGDRLSILGFGCMRFPRSEQEVERMVAHAVEHGVNYFDTAYIYPGSEAMLGKVLASTGLRDQVNIATKLPPYLVKKYEDLDKLLNTQLKRLQTDRIEYYLVHMLTDVSEWNRLVELGILHWVAEKKQRGQIVNFGFSYHGGKVPFVKLIDACDWDFCMLQYNYFDEHNQAGREGLLYAAGKDIPVVVMEPLRGGSLAGRLPAEVEDLWRNYTPVRTPVDWALRWVWNHPQVMTVLSGMGSMEMVEQNLRTASSAEPDSLTEDDLAQFDQARRVILDQTNVPCTGCNYCMPCPAGVDIPLCFSSYNDAAMNGKFMTQAHYVIRTNNHNASLCTKCGKCETHCPQAIPIREELSNTANTLERFPYRPMRFVVRKVMRLS